MVWRLYVAMDAPAGAAGEEAEGVIHAEGLSWSAAAMAHAVTGRRVMRQVTNGRDVRNYFTPGADLWLTVGMVSVQVPEPEWWNRTLAQAMAELGMPP